MLESTENLEAYKQETDISVMLALAKQVSRKSFVDVGAEKGRISHALLKAGFQGVLFEPFPAHLPGLRRLVEGTASRVYGFAIDEMDHEGTLHIAVDSEGKQMDYFHSLLRVEAHPLVRHDQSIPVQCRSLASLAREGLIGKEIGFLKIDTEGYDLNVIRGMGDVRAEVLVCEFFTPRLYAEWSGAFPDALTKAAFDRGYEACIAVKRMLGHEFVVFDPHGFIDGQWGNLVFTSHELFDRARAELARIAYDSEKALAASLYRHAEALEAKEAVIRELAAACEARLDKMKRLTTELERLQRQGGTQ
jgi:FkbM family methyltransferase